MFFVLEHLLWVFPHELWGCLGNSYIYLWASREGEGKALGLPDSQKPKFGHLGKGLPPAGSSPGYQAPAAGALPKCRPHLPVASPSIPAALGTSASPGWGTPGCHPPVGRGGAEVLCCSGAPREERGVAVTPAQQLLPPIPARRGCRSRSRSSSWEWKLRR